MNLKTISTLGVLLLVLAGCGGSTGSDRAVPAPPATNNNGNPTTGTITANFDPAGGVLPFPNNLLLLGTTDLTLNIPVADPTDFSNPQVALNALDGFSTVAPWSAGFSARINPATIVPGSSVRVFQVQLVPGTAAVASVVRELTPGAEYVAVPSSVDPDGASIAILPLQPLQELTAYMAVITNGITDTNGNDATPSQTYFLGKRTSPLVDANGNSTDPLLPAATAQALEPLRQIINSQEAAAAAAGLDPSRIVLSWTMTTQSITPVLNAVRSTAQAAPVTLAPTGLTTAQVLPGSPGLADINIGVISMPYYLGIPQPTTPTLPLTEFWRAEPGAYLPPFDQLGLDPTSTHVTVANPFPVANGVQTVPVLMTVPNASSGHTRPAAGWPLVIYQHGITRNRSDALAIADTFASQGVAVVAIDLPLHGITDTALGDPTQPLAALYVGNTPFGLLANERTFDLDLVNNATSAPGPDGVIDGSGTHFINLASLLTSRDNIRQGQADLSVLTLSVDNMDIDADGVGDFDSARVSFVGQSLGSITGIAYLAVEPNVSTAVLSVPGGGIAQLLNGSDTFGPRIRAGLAASAGLQPGTADFEAFLGAAQAAVDSADPVNWGAITAATNAVLVHEVIGDSVIPNAVATAPLAGTEPLLRVMELDLINDTLVDAMGARAGLRFVPPATHGSLLDPTTSPAATAEMQAQMAGFVLSRGTAVQVNNPSVIQNP
ncbi:MAG: Ig-like domain-containing protein [Xanthomonadales bacterium]|nr:Ig-like domain-containing protein [Xanthomonadales bacterium]